MKRILRFTALLLWFHSAISPLVRAQEDTAVSGRDDSGIMIRLTESEAELDGLKNRLRAAELWQKTSRDSLVKIKTGMEAMRSSLMDSIGKLNDELMAHDSLSRAELERFTSETIKSGKRDVSLMLLLFILLTSAFSVLLYRNYLLERKVSQAIDKEEIRMDKKLRYLVRQLQKKLKVKSLRIHPKRSSGKTDGSGG